MKAIDLLQTYPKAAEVIREWFFNQMVSSLKEDPTIPEDYRRGMIAEGVTDERLAVFIDVQPRALFDVLDENNVFITIERGEEGTMAADRFQWSITCNGKTSQSPVANKLRRDAEVSAITEAFAFLEVNLLGFPELEPNKIPPADEATGL